MGCIMGGRLTNLQRITKKVIISTVYYRLNCALQKLIHEESLHTGNLFLNFKKL